MPRRQDIEDFLEQRHVAVVGVSRNTKDFANVVYRHLRDGGRTMYPVNELADGPIEGDTAYGSLAEVPDPVDGVIVMVPAKRAADVVQSALDRGIPRVWLHKGAGPGAVSGDAVALCRDAGVPVVDGACPLMWDDAHGIHHLHKVVSGRRITRAVKPS